MRAHVAAKSLGILTAMLVLVAEVPFGAVDRHAGAALAGEDLVGSIRRDQERGKRRKKRSFVAMTSGS